VSEFGLSRFQDNQVRIEYEGVIPLVMSSKDETTVCPIEQFLCEHREEEEQWKFLGEKFTGEDENDRPLSCTLKFGGQNKNR